MCVCVRERGRARERRGPRSGGVFGSTNTLTKLRSIVVVCVRRAFFLSVVFVRKVSGVLSPRRSELRTRSRTQEGAQDARGADGMPHESLPPFVIITGAMTAIGLIQGALYSAVYGKPKHAGSDSWDAQIRRRDETLVRDSSQKQQK